MPSSSAYRSRFGSLLRAYTLVGYSPARDYDYVAVNRALRAMHPQVVSDAVEAIQRGRRRLCRLTRRTDLLTVNDEFTASIVISRCVALLSGALRWNIRLDASLRPDITVAIRMDAGQSDRARLLPVARASSLRPGLLAPARRERPLARRLPLRVPRRLLLPRISHADWEDRMTAAAADVRMIPGRPDHRAQSPLAEQAHLQRACDEHPAARTQEAHHGGPTAGPGWIRPRLRPGPTRGVHRSRPDRDRRGRDRRPPKRTASS